ncbi:uncharacterized protein IUM83_17945 [Phytophthora cinnamomi]|uniref:uncharacterized protein n=1 Tax=Phytophthora cinnamomi TaxID=4785 RepID=UPI003559F27F|nr:hypothetical protein IUM83_17945 [Phytophthora cinnamomi]
MDVDPSTWNLVKCNDQMKIYAERRWKRRHSSAQNASADDSSSDLQSMLCIGSICGTVDDVMAGIVDPSFKRSQTKTLFPNDLSGAVTLATVETPTPKDPFKSMSVKWLELDVRRRSMGYIKNRDYVYVEVTGVEYIPRMGQVGFHLMHSVDIPDARALAGRIRGKLSVCFFLRQKEEDSVSIYAMWMMNSMNDQARRVLVPHFAQMLLSSFKTSQDSKLKKLAQTFGKGYSGLNNLKLPVATPYYTCVTCSKRVWGVGKLTRHDNDNTCELCLGYVCSTCKIDKKPKFFISSLDESKKDLTFCFACFSSAMTSEASKLSFAENPGNSNGLIRRVCRSFRSLKSPGWNMRKTETSASFSDT